MLRKYPLALYSTWFMILLVLPLPLVLLLNLTLLEPTRTLLGYDFGIIAYVWWLSIVLLSTKPQWLDRRIGLPAMHFVHGMLGVLASVLICFHAIISLSMATVDLRVKNIGNIAWHLSVFELLFAVFFLSGVFNRWPLVARLKQKLQVVFKHQVSVWIHRFNFVAIGLIWWHVHLFGRITNLTSFLILFDAYTVVTIGFYVWQHFIADQSERLTT